MATVSPVEAQIQDILSLRDHCTLTLSDEILQRIRLIREKCVQAEAREGTVPISWRRGPPSSSNGGGSGGSGGSKQLPNKWRNSVGGGNSNGNGHTNTNGGGNHHRPPPPNHQPNRGPHQKYVSKFQNTDTPVEDKILNTVILNKLNKFSASNYDEIKGFLQQILDDDASDFLKAFMLLIFKKAATESNFCPLYARMIAELSDSYVVLRSELKELYIKYLDIFDEVSEEQCKDYETFVQRNREKQLRLGYSQFLAELTRLGALELSDLEVLYSKVVTQIYNLGKEGTSKSLVIDEYLDCLLKMSQAFSAGKSAKLTEIRNGLSEMCVPKLTEIYSQRSSNFPGVSKKGSFTILDCLDIFKV
jgi:hypothetical protein